MNMCIFFQPVAYLWTVSNSQSMNIHNSTPDAYRKVNFESRGIYQIQLNASNLISKVTTQIQVIAEIPVSGLTLKLLGNGSQYVTVGTSVSLNASVTSGSNVQFFWSNPPSNVKRLEVKKTNWYSVVNFTFNRQGEFSVAVNASNTYNYTSISYEFIVQQPISGLRVSSPSMVAVGHVIMLNLSVTEGSHVGFDVDFGDGEGPRRVNHIPEGKTGKATNTYTVPGKKDILITAHNQVS